MDALRPGSPLLLAELTREHVLKVYDAAVTALRGEYDLRRVQARLSLLDCLAPLTFSLELGVLRLLPGPGAALGQFLARCQRSE